MARPRKPPLPLKTQKAIRRLYRAKHDMKAIAVAVGMTEFAVSVWLKLNVIGMGKDPGWKLLKEWPTMPEKFEDDPRAVRSSGVIIVRPTYASDGGFATVSTLASSYRAKR